MWKTFNFWIGMVIGTVVAIKVDDISTNNLVFWCFLSLVNFIFALEQSLTGKNN